ncbi:hypothetical protein K438DRAFT_1776170 [Mycena galopus ATCC 62051]|nr:hypothetical protein K438DRAFT_1776170 [Mycena galopus ATCC 62051]
MFPDGGGTAHVRNIRKTERLWHVWLNLAASGSYGSEFQTCHFSMLVPFCNNSRMKDCYDPPALRVNFRVLERFSINGFKVLFTKEMPPSPASTPVKSQNNQQLSSLEPPIAPVITVSARLPLKLQESSSRGLTETQSQLQVNSFCSACLKNGSLYARVLLQVLKALRSKPTSSAIVLCGLTGVSLELNLQTASLAHTLRPGSLDCVARLDLQMT